MQLQKHIHKINETAQYDWNRAQGMLDMLNDIMHTNYGWLCKRVVWSEKSKDDPAEFYGHAHDLEASLSK
jgi:hypothetical protein